MGLKDGVRRTYTFATFSINARRDDLRNRVTLSPPLDVKSLRHEILCGNIIGLVGCGLIVNCPVVNRNSGWINDKHVGRGLG